MKMESNNLNDTPKIYQGEYIKYEPDVIPVDANNYQDEFLYGKSIEKLDAKQIKGISSQFYVGTISSLPTATGTVSITGVGFTPRLIKFTSVAVFNSGKSAFSIGTYDGTTNRSIRGSDGSVFRGVSATVVHLYDATSTNSWQATVSSIDADGFTLNYSNILNDTSGGNIMFECYK